MDELNERKKGRGHPPWTEAQKQAKREEWAKRKAAKAEAEQAAEKEYLRLRKDGTPDRRWGPEWKAKCAKTTQARRKKVDEERKELIRKNPGVSKSKLGISYQWKPADGSDDGYVGRYLREARISIDLPPINIADPEQVQNRINEYLDFCEQNNKIPQMIGVANWLGIGRTTLTEWKNGQVRENTHRPIIQRTLMMLEEIWVDLMQNNKVNPANGIFLAKNLMQYKDQTDIAVAPAEEKIKSMSDEEIAKWYLEDGKTVETGFTDEPKVEPKSEPSSEN